MQTKMKKSAHQKAVERMELEAQRAVARVRLLEKLFVEMKKKEKVS